MVIWPPIHSIVVVTSPIGDQAPPALAAITMMAANSSRSSRWSSSLRVSEIITMVVVRLSRTALRKKVTRPTCQLSVVSRLVRICEVMISKPLWASITSTITIAPIRKKMICADDATEWSSWPTTTA